jgi:L-ascorbate metabolism protein UlaG (beta-lactamase superfamily)
LVTWFGWGTFRIVAEGTTLIVDPCVTSLIDEPHAEPVDCEADAMLLTHGHHEHIRDAHRFALPTLAPPQVAAWFGCPAIEPDETREHAGVSVTAREFPHLQKHDAGGKLAILRRNGALGSAVRHLPRVLASAWAIRGQPNQGPYLAYDLRFATVRIFLTCEAFTELLDPDVAEAWGEGGIDLAVVGVESGQEAAASALAKRLGAAVTVGAAVHAPFERFYGKPRVTGFAYPMLRPGESIQIVP